MLRYVPCFRIFIIKGERRGGKLWLCGWVGGRLRKRSIYEVSEQVIDMLALLTRGFS